MAKTKNPNHRPWGSESSGLDGYWKSEAWTAFETAGKDLKAAETYLAAQTSLPQDVAAGLQNQFQELATKWQADFDKVKGYSEKWTNWLKYINLGESYSQQFKLLKMNAQDAAGGSVSAQANAKEEPKKKPVVKDSVVSPPPASSAAESKAKGENVTIPTLPFFSDPVNVAMVAGGVLLTAAVVWALWPEGKSSMAGLRRYRRRSR